MSDSSISVSKRKIHKKKIAEQQYEDQLSDLWHLQEKKNRLNREDLCKSVKNES